MILLLRALPLAILALPASCMDVQIWDNKDCHGGTNRYKNGSRYQSSFMR
jgi:hypothetical protein